MLSDDTFLLAVICGETAFLNGVGLKHDKGITSHLFNGDIRKDMLGQTELCEGRAKVSA